MSRSRVNDEILANIFARAYAETGSIADAFWVTESVLRRRSTFDVAAHGINALIQATAETHRLRPEQILGTDSGRAASSARAEVYWKLRQRQPPVAFEAIGVAFDRTHPTVIAGVQKFERMLAESAELRARIAWETAQAERAA
jgi:chromosomal replication initiation ATPase DnaA